MELIFCSHNENKKKEIQQKMPEGISIKSLSDVAYHDDIVEDALTFEGNAYLKASCISEKFGKACFADDSGLEVHALNMEPGVFSARYAGAEKSDDRNNEKLLSELQGKSNRNAQFKTVLCLIMDGETHYFEGIVKGEIIHEKRGDNGFGYDPLFIPEGSSKTFAEMTMEEKNSFSHRARAFDQMLSFLKQN